MRNPPWGPRHNQTPKLSGVAASSNGTGSPEWNPTDGSGAGLTYTVNAAKWSRLGRLMFISLYLVFPATASGASAQINGLPVAAANICQSGIYASGTGGATTAQISGTSINIFAPNNVPVTNAQLSGAFVIMTFFYFV